MVAIPLWVRGVDVTHEQHEVCNTVCLQDIEHRAHGHVGENMYATGRGMLITNAYGAGGRSPSICTYAWRRATVAVHSRRTTSRKGGSYPTWYLLTRCSKHRLLNREQRHEFQSLQWGQLQETESTAPTAAGSLSTSTPAARRTPTALHLVDIPADCTATVES